MGGRGAIVSARLSLSVRPAQPQLDCAFSCEGEEVSRTAKPLPNQGLLRKCRDEIALAAHGRPRAPSNLPSMQRELRRVISRPAIAFLRAMLMQRPEVDTLALEIMLNDPGRARRLSVGTALAAVACRRSRGQCPCFRDIRPGQAQVLRYSAGPLSWRPSGDHTG